MKEKLMKEIQQQMGNSLNERQQELLKLVLHRSLLNYSISELVGGDAQEDSYENQRLVDMFLPLSEWRGALKRRCVITLQRFNIFLSRSTRVFAMLSPMI